MMKEIYTQLETVLKSAGVTGDIEFSTPPNPEMGNLAFACFAYAKGVGGNPAEVAKELESKIRNLKSEMIRDVKAFGPYVNFFLNPNEVSKLVLSGMEGNDTYGHLDLGTGNQIMVEFGCPNPMKAFHLGHLRNLITGESVVRLMENAGYEVIRTNYQGDVGRHIAMSLWGIFDLQDEFEKMKEAPLKQRVEFLGKAYAHGATEFEKSETVQAEVLEYNRKVYESDASIQDVYQTARSWSLAYFDTIYDSLGASFDHMYFESETFARGKEIALEGVQKGVLLESEGAIIFPGETFGLHNRVFINSQGYPTYEAKDLALSELHFKDYNNVSEIIHVVGKDQTEYFKVVFKAIEELGMAGAGKEFHLIGGYLQLKGDKKMSSRKGNIVTGDLLLEMVQERIADVMKESELENKEEVLMKVTGAALKYSLLRADISKDVAFDLEESISTSGNSGPYLLYIVARINSILKKLGVSELQTVDSINFDSLAVSADEQALVFALASYPEVTAKATAERDTSVVSKYLFELAQTFNSFYHTSSVQDAAGDTRSFRLHLISETKRVMTKGLDLLGISTVEEM